MPLNLNKNFQKMADAILCFSKTNLIGLIIAFSLTAQANNLSTSVETGNSYEKAKNL